MKESSGFRFKVLGGVILIGVVLIAMALAWPGGESPTAVVSPPGSASAPVLASPSVDATQEPSQPQPAGAADLETVTYADPGFAVDVPSRWTSAQEVEGVVRLRGPGGQILVLAGATDGSIRPCAVFVHLPCDEDSITWEAVPQYPDDLATMRLAELVAGVLRRDLTTGTAVMADVISRPRDLGGVPAVSVRLRCQSCWAPGIDWRYVVAVNGRQPWIIGLLPSGSAPAALRPILESFRFVDEPTRSADPSAFVEPSGVYRVDLPRDWRAGDEFLPGAVTFFGPDVGGEIVMAVIFLGNPDGSIRLCQFGPCQTVTVHTLDELRAAVQVTNPAGYGNALGPSATAFTRAAAAVVRATTLGGEPAEKKRANTSRGWLLGPEMYDWVYAIHDGRPVAIRLDHWPRGGDSGRTEFVESFEFLDGTAGTQTIEFTDAGFTVDVPAG